MDPVILARLQFASTTVYHFFFVPLTLGLVWIVAILHTQYYRTGDEKFKRLTNSIPARRFTIKCLLALLAKVIF